MHNKPVNSETNIIKNIFNNSLNEDFRVNISKSSEELAKAAKSAAQSIEQGISNVSSNRRVPDNVVDEKGWPVSDTKVQPDVMDFTGSQIRFDKLRRLPGAGPLPKEKQISVPTAAPQVGVGISSQAAERLKGMGFTPDQMPIVDSGAEKTPEKTPEQPQSQLDRELGGVSPTGRLKAMQARWDAEKMDDLNKRVDAASKKVDEFGAGLTKPWNVSKPTPTAPKMSEKEVQNKVVNTVMNILNTPNKSGSLPVPDAVDSRYPGKKPATPTATPKDISPSLMRSRPTSSTPIEAPPTEPTKAPGYSGPYSQRAPEATAPAPKRETVMITKMNKSGEYENVAADLSNDEDLRRIQPGSASYGQLTDAEKARRNALKEHYYNILSNKLEESEGYEGINQAEYGFTPAAGRKTARLAKRYKEEPMVSWSGDTSAETPEDSTEPMEKVSNPDEFVSQKVKSLMSQAQEKGIELSHGRAQEIAIKELKKHLGQHD